MSQQPLTTISAAQLRQAISEGAEPRILDVRTGGEFKSAHIAGSHNVPLDTMNGHLVNLASGDEPIVVVCHSGSRADNACQQLISAGRSSLTLLEGGIQAWQGVGGEVVTGTGTWAMDRQVRFVAGFLILAGMLASLVIADAKWFAAAIGLGLFVSAVTNTCTMGAVLSKLPYNKKSETSPAEVQQAVASLIA